ncbi:MAG: AzlD domain-containing protein [Lachnospiraceae bacterium]|nr:AzlD domain-containing protein [Lachnospiraceae bacterium]
MNPSVIVLAMAVTTALIRALPFLVFRKNIPPYITYLGQVLPSAIIGMLVVYCLKDTNIMIHPFGLPELIAVICVVTLQVFKRNSLISILGGTVIYMLLVQMVF